LVEPLVAPLVDESADWKADQLVEQMGLSWAEMLVVWMVYGMVVMSETILVDEKVDYLAVQLVAILVGK
jgi:hypothetical protein